MKKLTFDVDPTRFGRVPSVPDPRNALYSASKTLSHMEMVRPRSYTWSLDISLDQLGNDCVGNAYCHELAARPVVVKGVSEYYAKGYYEDARRVDEIPGEDYEGTTVHGGARVGRARGFYSAYYWIQNEDELAAVVGHRGPVVAGISWKAGMLRPNKDGVIRAIGGDVGGHAILVTGINHPRERYKIKNSWGRDWGVTGSAYLSREEMAMLLEENGEAIWCQRTDLRSVEAA